MDGTGIANRLAINGIGYNASAGKWRSEAMRSHASPRLIYFAKGQGRITVAGLTRGYGPNNLIFVPANTMYGFEIGPTVFGTLLTIPSAMQSEWPESPQHLRLRDVIAQKEFAQLFDALERELLSERPGHGRAAHHHLGLLSVMFERHCQLHSEIIQSDQEQRRTASARLVAAYSDLVERDFRTKRNVADYAAALGVTPTHLTRCCNKTCSKSALALLNDRILFEARMQLRGTKNPIQDIAHNLGFTSPAYFSRSFQSATGMTPSAFRRRGPINFSF